MDFWTAWWGIHGSSGVWDSSWPGSLQTLYRLLRCSCCVIALSLVRREEGSLQFYNYVEGLQE